MRDSEQHLSLFGFGERLAGFNSPARSGGSEIPWGGLFLAMLFLLPLAWETNQNKPTHKQERVSMKDTNMCQKGKPVTEAETPIFYNLGEMEIGVSLTQIKRKLAATLTPNKKKRTVKLTPIPPKEK